MQMHVPSDEGSVSQVMTDAERAAVIADGQDPNNLADDLESQCVFGGPDDPCGDCVRCAAAAMLRQQAEQLDHYRANYTQTCGELFHLTAERDEYRRQLAERDQQLDALRNAIENHKREGGGNMSADWNLWFAVDALAAAGGGVPETKENHDG